MTEVNSARFSVGAKDFFGSESPNFELFLLTPSPAYRGRGAFGAQMTKFIYFLLPQQMKLTSKNLG